MDCTSTTEWKRLREIWRGMLKRCQNKHCKDHEHYSGRGITVCDEWQEFRPFYDWAMSHGYKNTLTLDRVNNNLGYFPGNCRWASRKLQGKNRSTTTLYTINGKTRNLHDWSEEIGIPETTILRRLGLGWSVQDAFTRPIQKHKK